MKITKDQCKKFIECINEYEDDPEIKTEEDRVSLRIKYNDYVRLELILKKGYKGMWLEILKNEEINYWSSNYIYCWYGNKVRRAGFKKYGQLLKSAYEGLPQGMTLDKLMSR